MLNRYRLTKLLTKLAITLIFLGIISPSIAYSAPKNISFQSRIYKPDGTPLEASSVQFLFSLMNPLSTCVIYSETFSSVDLTGTAGNIVLALGAGTRSYPVAGGMQWYDAFNNSTTLYTCQTSGTYSPTLIDPRRLVMQFNDGSAAGWQTLPPMDINSVPFAMFAERAEIVPITGLTQGGATAGQVLKWNGTSWAASADNTGGTGVVSSVSSTNAYLSVANGSSTPALTVNVGVVANTVAAGDDLRIIGAFQTSTALSGDLSGTLPNPTLAVINGGGTGTKITYDTKGRVTSSTSLNSADVTSALGYTPSNGSNALATSNIFVGNGSGFAEGRALSGDATISSLGIITFTNSAATRTNLGLGSAAVLNVGTGPGTVAAGDDARFTNARVPTGTASGDLSGTYPSPTLAVINGGGTGTKITYDTKGRVTSSTSLNSADVTSALGYTPGAGSGTVTSITAGTGLTGGVISTSGTFGLGSELTGINAIVTTGFVKRTGVGAYTASTVDLSTDVTGTLSALRMPAAASNADGIVNQIAQSFSGIKTFVNNVVMQSALSVSGGVTASGDITAAGAGSFDRIKLANSSAICNGTTEGSLKYNSTSKKMEYCNGTSWTNMSSGTIANLSIGAPSSSLVKTGPVTFTVTYGSNTDTATITLAIGNVTLSGTDTSGCAVTSVTGSGSTRTVTVNSCTGTGTVAINIAGATANSSTGDTAPAAGPSATYGVDNTGPTAPTGVSLGSVPSNLTNTPTITYSAASDVGGSTVANHQVQIIRTSDSSVIRAWANHTSGSDVGSLTLLTNTQYSVLVRAVDALGNNGTQTAAVNWTTINDPCLGSPSPGTVCTGGAIFLGSLSPGATSGSGTDKYMTMPGGCSDIPAGSVSGGSGTTSYANADFTPASCSGSDSFTKTWDDGAGAWYNIPGLADQSTTYGTGYGASNTDLYYGSSNTTNMAAITASVQGGYHAAARYCDRLSYGGYTDWYLPNRFELNLMFTNRAVIPGLVQDGTFYWSSTEYVNTASWVQSFFNGTQDYRTKNNPFKVRCVRRF